jgi:4-oxalocrotonate tautomerase
MPLARIDLIEGKSADYRAGIGEVIYAAMLSTLDVPAHDRFQIITEHRADQMVMDQTYLGITRTEDCVIIQITLNEGRTVEKKAAFYHAVAAGLHTRIGLRKENVFINLIEVKKENWSFGNGQAQYAPK